METLPIWSACRCVHYNKSLLYVFTQRELNLWQKRWLDLLKDYDMNVFYHLLKVNVVADVLSGMPTGSVNIAFEDKELVKYVHRLDLLGVKLENSPKGGSMVHHNSESF